MDRPYPSADAGKSELLRTSRSLILRTRDETAEARSRIGRSRQIVAQSLERLQRLRRFGVLSYGASTPSPDRPRTRRRGIARRGSRS